MTNCQSTHTFTTFSNVFLDVQLYLNAYLVHILTMMFSTPKHNLKTQKKPILIELSVHVMLPRRIGSRIKDKCDSHNAKADSFIRGVFTKKAFDLNTWTRLKRKERSCSLSSIKRSPNAVKSSDCTFSTYMNDTIKLNSSYLYRNSKEFNGNFYTRFRTMRFSNFCKLNHSVSVKNQTTYHQEYV